MSVDTSVCLCDKSLALLSVCSTAFISINNLTSQCTLRFLFKLFCWTFSPSLLGTGDCIGDKSLAPLSVGTSYFIFFNNLTSLLAIILWYAFPRLSSPLVLASVINHLRLIVYTSDFISFNNAPSQSRLSSLFKLLCPSTLVFASVINHLRLS